MDWKEKWKKIEEARKLLKLPLKTTRKDIIESYRKLVKTAHPDKGGNEEYIKKLNSAYELLIEYCDNYIINLAPNDDGASPSEWWFRHFGSDPIWGQQEED